MVDETSGAQPPNNLPEPPEPDSQEVGGEAFKTPEEAAKDDANTAAPVQAAAETKPQDQKQSWLHKLKARWQSFSKKKKIIVAVAAAVVLLAIIGSIVFAFTRPHSKPLPLKKPTITVTPKPTTVPSNLTGLPVNPSVNKRPVTGVMIENSDAARPQSGLDQAGVVFEAIAEAGITRFLALYQDTQPDYLGPVRSARPYFVEWDMGFDAPLAHVGGSPEALNDIAAWHVEDLDQFYNGASYERITSRYAPHNVYTSAAQLNALEKSKGFTTSHFTGFLRKTDSPSKKPNATDIHINPSSADYNDQYIYVSSANDYKRYEGGEPHMEIHADGKQDQITPKVVIALVMNYSLEADGYHSEYNVIGSGPVYIFQDGTVATGTWQKTSKTSQITFTNGQGQPIALNAGQTWITAVGSASDVSYK